jgi:hypothetical protein
MNQKDRFDSCMKLAEFGAARWDARRRYEWSLSLGLWALLAAAIYQFRIEMIPGWVFIIGPIIYLLWMNNIWWSNYIDRNLMRAFRDHARAILSVDHIKFEYPYRRPVAEWVTHRVTLNRWVGFLLDWAAFFQIAVTSTLAILVFKLCQQRPITPWAWLASWF